MPTGRTVSSRTIENIANCNQPLADMSELLRVKEGRAEVDEQQERKQEGDYGDEVHGLPQLLTGLDVKKGHGKENGGEEEHGQILHETVLEFGTAHSGTNAWSSKID